MMFYTFNELSLQSDEHANGLELIEQLAETCSELFNKGFRSIKFGSRDAFLSHEFTAGITVASILKMSHGLSERQKKLFQRLKSIISASSNIWDKEHREIIDACPLIFIVQDQQQELTEGLKIACVLKTISVSLLCHPFWDQSTILGTLVEETDSGVFQQLIPIKHATKTNHLLDHQDWFGVMFKKRKVFTTWNPATEYFPNIEYSDELVKDGDWDYFVKERDAAKSAEQRLSIIIKYGHAVAERNGYSHNPALSTRNTTKKKKRIIFEAGIGRHRIYLSMDLEKGGFEVCNYKGYHLGEHRYNGTQRTGPLNHHSIYVS